MSQQQQPQQPNAPPPYGQFAHCKQKQQNRFCKFADDAQKYPSMYPDPNAQG